MSKPSEILQIQYAGQDRGDVRCNETHSNRAETVTVPQVRYLTRVVFVPGGVQQQGPPIQKENSCVIVWDVGGQRRIRPLRRHHYQGTNDLICVADNNDREWIQDAKEDC